MGLVKPSKERSEAVVDRREQQRDYAGLLAQLHGDTAAERRWAARDLAAYPQASQALCEQLALETCASVRDVLLTSLAQHNTTAAASGLLPLLRSSDAALRNGVIQTLHQMPEVVAPHMQTLLADADPDVRIFAVNVLESLRHPNTPHWLRDVIDEDDHINVCATAVDLLAEIGDRDVIPALNRLVERFPQQPFIAFAVQLAVRRIEATD
jgi:HEAT repeat protein